MDFPQTGWHYISEDSTLNTPWFEKFAQLTVCNKESLRFDFTVFFLAVISMDQEWLHIFETLSKSDKILITLGTANI